MRFGIIGTNFISDWFCEALSRTSCATAAAVYSRTMEKGTEFAARHDIPCHFDNLDAMLASDIDAVYVASPTFMHGTQAIAAMRAGKHVLVEKMMASSYEIAAEMRSVAEQSGVVLLEAMRPAFDPSSEAIRHAISKIGRLRRAHLEYCQYSSRYDSFRSGRVLNAFDPGICNSALADIGIYPLHMALYYFGSPNAVSARSVLLDNGFEGAGEMLMEYDGMLCNVSYSKINDGRGVSVIEGEDGSVVFDRVNGPRRIELCLRGETPRMVEFEYVEKNMVFEIEAFYRAAECGCEYKHHLDRSVEAARIATEVYRLGGAIKYMPPELMRP